MYRGGEGLLQGLCVRFDSYCIHQSERRLMKVIRSRISTGILIDELTLQEATTVLLPFYYKQFLGVAKKFRTHVRNRLKDGEPMFSEIYRYQIEKGE